MTVEQMQYGRGLPDWFMRRFPGKTSTAVVTSSGTIDVQPDQEVTLLQLTGRGWIDGFVLHVGNANGLVYQKLKIEVDGVAYDYHMGVYFSPLIVESAKTGTYSKPVSLIELDSTRKIYKYAWTSPIHFSKSVKIVYRNEADTQFHRIALTASAALEL